MADVVHWHSRRIAACVLLLFYVNRRRRNRKRWRNRKIWTKLYRRSRFSASSSFFLLVFCVFVCCRRNVPQIRTILNFLDELKSCLTIVFTSVRHFVKCQANHVNRACFDWLTITNTRLPIVHTSNTSLPTRKSW